MMTTTFKPDFPLATVIPAHPSNYGSLPGRHMQPRAIVLHTPEEPANDNDVTPIWFQNPNANVSTHYFVSYPEGRVVQMVPESERAWAQGVIFDTAEWKGYPGVFPTWTEGNADVNLFAISIEMEGYAATIHETMKRGGVQWSALVAWIVYVVKKYDIPLDRDHIVGHDEIASYKHDPGPLFDWDGLMEDLRELALKKDTEPGRSNVVTALLSARGSIDAALELLRGDEWGA